MILIPNKTEYDDENRMNNSKKKNFFSYDDVVSNERCVETCLEALLFNHSHEIIL